MERERKPHVGSFIIAEREPEKPETGDTQTQTQMQTQTQTQRTSFA
jgi:hypothetical protein